MLHNPACAQNLDRTAFALLRNDCSNYGLAYASASAGIEAHFNSTINYECTWLSTPKKATDMQFKDNLVMSPRARAIMNGAATCAVAGAVGGFVLGSGNTWSQDGTFAPGLQNGGATAALGALIGGAFGAASGWFGTTHAGQKVGSWMKAHSKGRFFSRHNNNPYNPFYKEDKDSE